MSWNSPTNYAEVVSSIERGYSFSARSLRIKGDRADAVCGHYSTRSDLDGHLDMFARRIVVSNDELHARYMSGENRDELKRNDDVVYYVIRDGNALAYLTRDGRIVVNERVRTGLPRYVNTLSRILPALSALSVRIIEEDAREAREYAQDRIDA